MHAARFIGGPKNGDQMVLPEERSVIEILGPSVTPIVYSDAMKNSIIELQHGIYEQRNKGSIEYIWKGWK